MTDRTQDSSPAIVFEQVTFDRGRHRIFDGIDLEVPRGKVTAIMGPSGTGKTTLLRLIGGQLRPTSGKVWVDGVEVSRASRRTLYDLRRRMGMLFQNGALFTDLSVTENVAFPLREHSKLPEVLIQRIVTMKLQAVGLRSAAELMPAELSGGMARRVALARALALDPELMFYDEPFTGQDPINKGVLVRLIDSLNDALGLTSVLVSHDVAEALSIAEHAIVVGGGKVVGSGSPESLQQQKGDSPWLTQFLDGEPDGPVPFDRSETDYSVALGLAQDVATEERP